MDPNNALMINALMEKADADPMLKARLLSDPEAVATEYHVMFDRDQVIHLKSAGELHKLTDEMIASLRRGPVYDHAEKWIEAKVASMIQWPKPGPIGYPYERIRDLYKEYIDFKEFVAAKAVAAKAVGATAK